MKFLIVFTAVVTILQTFRVTIFYFRKDIKCLKKTFETILLIIMVILCYFNLKEIKISIYLSIVPLLYIIVMFVYERLLSKEYISILSIKNALDMSDSGIMFLDNEEIFLINNTMKNILNDLNIHNDYINNLIRMYHIIGVNISLSNNLPSNEKIANVFFEIIREAATNAIIHANSKNIDIILNISHDKIEMIITNDGKKNNDVIYENEGIKGMRRKLSEIGGNLTIINDNIFTLIIVV